jgi:hypothetical protein
MIIFHVEAKGTLPIINAEKIMPAFMDGLAEWTLNTAKAMAPVRTGRLRESIHISKSVNTPGEYIRDITAGVHYAQVVEKGRTKFAPFPGRHYMRQTAYLAAVFIKLYAPIIMQVGVSESVV